MQHAMEVLSVLWIDLFLKIAKQIPEGDWYCETCKAKEQNAVC